jgi:hypothetical protein
MYNIALQNYQYEHDKTGPTKVYEIYGCSFAVSAGAIIVYAAHQDVHVRTTIPKT